MRLTLSDPGQLPSLLEALRNGGCVADQCAEAVVDVGFPWVATVADARQAIIELSFFARAWETAHPGLEIGVGALPER